MQRSQPSIHRRHRQGAVLIVLALGFVSLMGITALVVELGFISAVQAELQASSDAAAHAGALQLDGTAAGIDAAEVAAGALAQANPAAGRTIELGAWDGGEGEGIEIGVWDAASRMFAPGGAVAEVNAVHVVARLNDLPAWFSQVAFGRETLAASAGSIAARMVGGAGEVDCFLPMAVADCRVEEAMAVGSSMVDLVGNPANSDDVGWARPAASPSSSWLRGQLQDCGADGAVGVGDDIDLNNGVAASVLTELVRAIERSSASWDSAWGAQPARETASAVGASYYGNVLEGPILTFHDDSYCDGGGGFTETQAVSGFVWVAIYDVVATHAAAGKNIKVHMDFQHEHDMGTDVGGPNYGVIADYISLVQ